MVLKSPLTRGPSTLSTLIPGASFIPQSALNLTYFLSLVTEGLCQGPVGGLLMPFLFLLMACPALASLHLATLTLLPTAFLMPWSSTHSLPLSLLWSQFHFVLILLCIGLEMPSLLMASSHISSFPRLFLLFHINLFLSSTCSPHIDSPTDVKGTLQRDWENEQEKGPYVKKSVLQFTSHTKEGRNKPNSSLALTNLCSFGGKSIRSFPRPVVTKLWWAKMWCTLASSCSGKAEPSGGHTISTPDSRGRMWGMMTAGSAQACQVSLQDRAAWRLLFRPRQI